MSVTTKRNESARLSAVDWEHAALDLIAEEGVYAVAIESLAKKLGVTKGSFYWHFGSRDALIDAAFKRWETEEMETMLGDGGRLKTPNDRLLALFDQVSRRLPTHAVYGALFAAASHPLVAPVLRRIAEIRMDYVSSLLEELGMSKSSARHRARLTYTAYVGFLQLMQQHSVGLSSEEFEEYMMHVAETLIP